MNETQDINLPGIVTALLGGLAIFLYGLQRLTEGMKAVAGSRMKAILAQVTRNPVRGSIVGALFTGLIQSSSVTTVLVVGFVSAGLMTLKQSVGIILGSNVGSTVTAQIIAFKITSASSALIAIGFVMTTLPKPRGLRQYGILLFGLGMVFLGMNAMSDSAQPLRSYQPFINFMAHIDHPLLGIAAGLVFTAIVQSSAATAGVVIMLASQGLVTLEGGIALVLGANVGTCVTALLATIGKSRTALQAALLHLLFNVVGVLVWLPMIGVLAQLSTGISPEHPELAGAARWSAEVPRQIANAHTLFNVINMVIALPFAGLLVRLAESILPRHNGPAEEVGPKYLSPEFLHTPELAFDAIRHDLSRLAHLVWKMVVATPDLIRSGSRDDVDELAGKDEEVDRFQEAVLAYCRDLSNQVTNERQALILQTYVDITNQLEAIGDVVEGRLCNAGHEAIELGLQMSESTRDLVRPVQQAAATAVERVIESLRKDVPDDAQLVVESKEELEALVRRARQHILSRMSAPEPLRIEHYRIESTVIDAYASIHHNARRAAKDIVSLHRPAPASPTA